jgi:hypothetical protein
LINKLYSNYFPHSKMAISGYKNGHFEEMGMVANSGMRV